MRANQIKLFDTVAKTDRQMERRLPIVRADYWRWILYRSIVDDSVDTTIARAVVAHYATTTDPVARHASGRVVKPISVEADSDDADRNIRSIAAALLFDPISGPREFIDCSTLQRLTAGMVTDWRASLAGPLTLSLLYAHTFDALRALGDRYGIPGTEPYALAVRIMESRSFARHFPTELCWHVTTRKETTTDERDQAHPIPASFLRDALGADLSSARSE